jgi:hypothetical protein
MGTISPGTNLHAGRLQQRCRATAGPGTCLQLQFCMLVEAAAPVGVQAYLMWLLMS